MTKLALTIYINETDMSGDQPLYDVIIRRLLHLEIAGATAVHGVMGYGRHHKLHRRHLMGVTDDRPLVITAVDEAERIRAILPEMKRLVKEGLITVHEVELV